MEILTSDIMTIAASLFGLFGLGAFIVEIIVELTKELPYIKEIPTKLYVIVVSVIICLITIIGYAAYSNIHFEWYYCVLAILSSFPIAWIAMYGWDTFKELYDRFIISR